ncbi:AraC family transcriptional regulator [Aquirufa aurantiipilula]|uniref:AraC family transcriptional regulator n=1 Tax=Aquirufa aurantiipilula TaxID=2696561 RepID=UPI001CAA6092|nr:helix-turn-helix domain-containing protein [Aquirufa aurantiipilula]MBZ1326891.1 helix-turn-helix transcriptional regulator [Aquirufa aurantiipilula]
MEEKIKDKDIAIRNLDSVDSFNAYNEHSTLNPLLSIIDFSKSTPKCREWMRLGFYCIMLKDIHCGDLKYGISQYDYDAGTLLFFAPNQVYKVDKVGSMSMPQGLCLVFDEELIRGTSLQKQIHHYSFFSYEHNEALHVDEEERNNVMEILTKISREIKPELDALNKKILVTNIELLLDYCSRYYQRQFVNRKPMHQLISDKFSVMVREYIMNSKSDGYGLPTVSYFADKLHVSTNYLGDIIKKETHQTPIEMMHQIMINLAKELLHDFEKNISEISHQLGFTYAAHFTRFFKNKMGISPKEYRRNLNR